MNNCVLRRGQINGIEGKHYSQQRVLIVTTNLFLQECLLVNLNHTVTLRILNADIFLGRRKKQEYAERIRPTYGLLKDTEISNKGFICFYEKLALPNQNILLRI